MPPARRQKSRLFIVFLGAFAACAFGAFGFGVTRASAATDDSVPASVGFELGPYDAILDDWTVSAVIVSGDLLEGELVTVLLEGSSGATLWQGEARFTKPTLRIPLDEVVAVGPLASVTLAQKGYGRATVVVDAERVSVPPRAQTPNQPRAESTATPPEVKSEVIVLPPAQAIAVAGEAVSRGVASTPRLAVSLVVLLVVFAIVFKLPIVPVGSQGQWRR